MARNRLQLVLALCSCVLLAYSIARATRLSFVHDECLSYRIVLGDLSWKDTANHHPLNTKLMALARQWLGPAEWQLRSPNVVAHFFYLIFGLLLLRSLSTVPAVLVGFVLLNFNPFLLEFFSLARGYGLALGLSLAALFFLMKAFQQDILWARGAAALMSLACAALADLANYTWLNFHVALLAACVFLLIAEGNGPETGTFRAQRWLYAVILLTANGVFMRNIARRVWALKQQGQLYGRGREGFVTDTVTSLVDAYFYQKVDSSFLRTTLMASIIVAFVAAALAICMRAAKNRKTSFAALLLIVMIIAVAAPILEHRIIGTEYPVRRIALYYIPAWALLGAFTLDELLLNGSRKFEFSVKAFSLLLAAVMFSHLVRTINVHSTLDWWYDANTKTAMLELQRQSIPTAGDYVNMTNDWRFEPAITYYRTLLRYDWLNVAPRDALPTETTDVFYGSEADIQRLPFSYKVIRQYPDTDTVLAMFRR